MTQEEAKNRFVFSKKINLKDPTGELTQEYITIREPTMYEVQKIQGKGEDELTEAIREIMPACITASSFTTEDGKPLKGREVFNILDLSASVMSEVMEEWLNSCPFTLRHKNSEK